MGGFLGSVCLCGADVTLGRCMTPVSASFDPQYSQKEDKYEEEIKVLTDKLKEASFTTPFIWGLWPEARLFQYCGYCRPTVSLSVTFRLILKIPSLSTTG